MTNKQDEEFPLISRERAEFAVPKTDCSGREYTPDEWEDNVRYVLYGAEIQRDKDKYDSYPLIYKGASIRFPEAKDEELLLTPEEIITELELSGQAYRLVMPQSVFLAISDILDKAQLAHCKPLIENDAYMRGWRKGNELKQKRLDIKLNRARKAERERIIKLLDDSNMICPEDEQCSACEEFRQALKSS